MDEPGDSAPTPQETALTAESEWNELGQFWARVIAALLRALAFPLFIGLHWGIDYLLGRVVPDGMVRALALARVGVFLVFLCVYIQLAIEILAVFMPGIRPRVLSFQIGQIFKLDRSRWRSAMVAVLRNSIITGLKELRAASMVIIPIVYLAYFVMRASLDELPTVVGVPLLIAFTLLLLFGQIRIRPVSPKQECDTKMPSQPQPPRKELSRSKVLLYGFLFAGMVMALVWSSAFLISAPIFWMLNVSMWMALKGFGLMLLSFTVFVTLLVFAAILEVWKFSTLLRKIISSIGSMALPSSHRGLFSLIGDYTSSNSEIRHT